MVSSSTTGDQQRRPESKTSTDSKVLPDVSDPEAEPADQSRNVHLSPGSAKQVYEKEEMVITSIRATDVAVALRRLPVGFHILVQHSGLQWRTENKPVPVDDDAVTWGGPIPIPSDFSATICLRVYASFEFQPVLGSGEELRELTVTMKQLWDYSANGHPFTFCPEVDDVISPCSSILVLVKRRQRESSDSLVSWTLDPCCSNIESRGQLEDATDLGHSAISRYRKYGDKLDLEQSVEQFERALDVCPQDNPFHAAAQSNLAIAKFFQCQVDNAGRSLNVPLTLYRNALAARPVGHPDRPSTLIQLAIVHLSQFEKLLEGRDAARAEEMLHEAVNLTSAGSHVKRAAFFLLEMRTGQKRNPADAGNHPLVLRRPISGLSQEDPWTLGTSLLHRFRRFGHLPDLQQAISVLEASVQSGPVPDQLYISRISTLGVALWCRFMRLGEPSDLEQAISRNKAIVDFIPNGDPTKSGRLNNLATTLRARFRLFGQLSDLEEAISRLKDAVDITPDGHPLKSDLLNNLCDSFRARFERLGDSGDLEQVISRYRNAVDITPDGHPLKPSRLSTLANFFRVRFEQLGDLDDLEQAISRQKESVDIIPDGDPNKPAYLFDLRNSFRTRFVRFGDPSDLERVISMDREAVNVTPNGHPHKPNHLHDLGGSFITRFGLLGEFSDLEQAIARYRDAVNLTSDCDPDKHGRLISLGNSFRARFERLGNLSDLEQMISTYRDAVNLTPDDRPEKPCRLNALGNFFRIRFERLGDLSDLEQAISKQKESVDITPDGHHHKYDHLFDLRNSFKTRFDQLRDESDLEQMISRDRELVDITPDGHPQKPSFLNAFGNSCFTRFERLGDLSDLEQAILLHRKAVNITTNGHPDKPGYLINLGILLRARFTRLGGLSDLDQAISRQRDVVELTSDGHPDKPDQLTNLGNSLLTRFEHFGEPSDLQEAISRHRDAVDFAPEGHRNKPRYLNNLGNSFIKRFIHLGGLNDLEEAIAMYSDAIYSTADGQFIHPHYLSNLGNCLRFRFDRLGELADLEQAILRHRTAVDLTPECHSEKPALLECLAESFIARFKRLGKLSDLEQATLLYSRAARASIGPIIFRFRASRKWISCSHTLRHHSLLHAYSAAIDLLPQLAWIGLPLTHRYQALVQAAGVVREGAATALDLGHPEIAVEWLEQGRAIVWGELFQLRTSCEELSFVHPGHARRLQELSTALEHASATREISLSLLSEQTRGAEYRATRSLEDEADRHRALAIERDKVLQEIRQFPGFERFLLRKEFSQLRSAAHSGPVVILNAAERRCDALIVLANKENVVHVPLQNFTLKRSGGLQSILDSLLGPSRGIPSDDRAGKPALRKDFTWESLLSTLWKGVVKPVLDVLGRTTPGDLARIFWCPTGPFTFLPIHAAGLYGAQYSEPGHKVFNFVVSSYVPTLGILMPPTRDTTSSGDFCVLAVPQPPSDGLPRLPGVHTELEYIRNVIRNSPAQAILLESSVGTVEEALGLMKDADWVHFACHGIQDSESPRDSGLCLADERRLKLSDMISLSRPRGGLAFLSACQTAMGDKKLSDEAVHIAAGMLFAGYGSVVGTMWSISDRVAPRLARDVYEQLFRSGTTPDYLGAAQALHDAVARLRDSGASFVEWVPFIHVGL